MLCPGAGGLRANLQAAAFEILENAAGEGPEAVVVAGPVALRPELLFFPERHLDIEEDLVSRRRPAVLAVHGASRESGNITETYSLPPRAGQAGGRADRPDTRDRPII